jgi:60 kDa SS-A/Ro ribonucleoprotein
MFLNTFTRHGAFVQREAIQHAANRLRDGTEISRARVFPYQLMAAYMNSDPLVPVDLAEAIQDAMEITIENIPEFAVDV